MVSQVDPTTWRPLAELHAGECSTVCVASFDITHGATPRGAGARAAENKIVVVKRAKITGYDRLLRWQTEVALMWKCRESTYVCNILAECIAPQSRAIVMEWAQFGSLDALLHDAEAERFCTLSDGFDTQRAALRRALARAEECTGTDALLAGWACDIACGVAYLHDVARVAHRDVKPANVLVRGDLRAQLTDLECCEALSGIDGVQKWSAQNGGYRGPTRGHMFRKMVGTLPYLAPEVLMREALHVSTDTYSLAVTLNEVATRMRPYADGRTACVKFHTMVNQDYSDTEIIRGVFADGVRPTTLHDAESPRLRGANGSMWSSFTALLAEGWQLDARRRPNPSCFAKRLCAIVARSSAACDISLGARARLIGVGAPAAGGIAGEDGAAAAPRAAVRATLGTATRDAPMASIAELTRAVDWAQLLGDRRAYARGAVGPFFARGKGEATAGRRGAKCMEDRMMSEQALELRGGSAEAVRALARVAEHLPAPGQAHLFAVFDGHGGSEAAQLAERALHRELLIGLAQEQRCVVAGVDRAAAAGGVAERALVRAFGAIDAAILAAGITGGTTAVALLLLGDLAIVANAGDCRAVLCRGSAVGSTAARGSSAIELSRDHVATDAAERARVEACGGAVVRTADGRLRVGGVCEVTRALGDAALKRHGVIATPDVTATKLDARDAFIILACDGVWDVLSSQRACAFVADTVRHVDFGAKRVVMEAFNYGSEDNLSAVIVYLFT